MRHGTEREKGETLTEILVSIVIIGLVASVFFSALATNSRASTAQRDDGTADSLLRRYAETAKQAARDTCTGDNTKSFAFVFPDARVTNSAATPLQCPSLFGITQIDITATVPGQKQKSLSIDVRTP